MVPLARFLTMLVFFLGLTFEGAAQDDYQQGYVVTNTNDTLHGMVRDRKTGASGEIYDKIRFKSKGRKKRLAPNDIQGYKIGNTEFKSLFLVYKIFSFIRFQALINKNAAIADTAVKIIAEVVSP